ncbi:ABC transporter permease [Streptomyces xinghaiensis]|uniref:ABC transporter permease n=1 Tax=Streptomyces xinghaiensis TaxID=1038928 RepID=UPI002E152945|nr:ABC transporter permease [Streptomyces xinghaiensis]
MPVGPAALSRALARTPSGAVSLAVLRAEVRLFRREPGAIFWIIAFPTLLLVILGLIPDFRRPGEDLGGLRVIDLYVPTVILLSTITAGLQSMPAVLTGYRERGILRRLSTTPARPVSLLTAQIAVHFGAILVAAAVALVVGRTAYGVAFPQQPFGYALAFGTATLSALALGTVISAVSPSTKISNVLGSLVFFPAMFTAGVWVPVQVMSGTLRTVVELTPLGSAAQALRQASAGDWPDWTHLGVSGLWALVLVVAAARWFRWE